MNQNYNDPKPENRRKPTRDFNYVKEPEDRFQTQTYGSKKWGSAG